MKLKYFFLLLLTLLIVNCSLLITHATVRYVSKTGTSTPPYTSWETAADSIQKCINICSFGDTVYVANGVYKENLVISTAVSLIGSSMDSTVIDGTNLATITIHIIQSGIGGIVENFQIRGKGFNLGAVILTEKSLFVKNCRLLNDQTGISIINNSVKTENILISNVSNGYYPSCISDTCNNYLTYNLIVLNSSNSIGFQTGIGGTLTINNNLIIFTGTNNPGHGISVGAPRKVFIENNLVSGFKNNIFFDTVTDTAFVINNLLLNAKSTFGSIASSANDVLVNNVVVENNINGIDGDWRVISNYNLFWKNNTNLQGVVLGNSDLVADPMFVNDTTPTANGEYDFHLQEFSPAIDKGNPDILDLDGTRSDIGIYGGPFGETYTYQDLAPLAPRNLSAVVDSNNITVKWKRNTEADTSFYKVYRDTVNNFTIDSTKLVSSSADTFFIQSNPQINTRYVYKITCVDNQRNESLPSVEIVVDITSMTDDEYPLTINDYILYQNYPNPFNPSTKIGYQLKERAYVKLMVYDIKGELVSVLVNKEQNAGYYETEFNVGSGLLSDPNVLASGIYLYRIEVIGEGSIPVYTEMKKMLLLK